MTELTVVLPEGVRADRVQVQIHMDDGPVFEQIAAGRKVRAYREAGGFRWTDVVLASGQEATVYARRGRERTAIEIVVSEGSA